MELFLFFLNAKILAHKSLPKLVKFANFDIYTWNGKKIHLNIKLQYVPEKWFSQNFFHSNLGKYSYTQKSFMKIASQEHVLILYLDDKFWPYLSENVKMGEVAQP